MIICSVSYYKAYPFQICHCCYRTVFRIRQICQAVSRVIGFINSFRCRCYIGELCRFTFFTYLDTCRFHCLCIRFKLPIIAYLVFRIIFIPYFDKRITIFIHILCRSISGFIVNALYGICHFLIIDFHRKCTYIIFRLTAYFCQTFADKFNGLCIGHGCMIITAVSYYKAYPFQIIYGCYGTRFRICQICQAVGRVIGFINSFRCRCYIGELCRFTFFTYLDTCRFHCLCIRFKLPIIAYLVFRIIFIPYFDKRITIFIHILCRSISGFIVNALYGICHFLIIDFHRKCTYIIFRLTAYFCQTFADKFNGLCIGHGCMIITAVSYYKAYPFQIIYGCYGTRFRICQICQAVGRVIGFINSFRCRCYIGELCRFTFFTYLDTCRFHCLCIRFKLPIIAYLVFRIIFIPYFDKRITIFIHILCRSISGFIVNALYGICHFLIIDFHRKCTYIIFRLTAYFCQTFADKFNGLCIGHGCMIITAVSYYKAYPFQIIYGCYGTRFRICQICQAVGRVIGFINSFRCRCYIRKLHRLIFFAQTYACRIDRARCCIRRSVRIRFIVLIAIFYKRIAIFIYIRCRSGSLLRIFCVDRFGNLFFIYLHSYFAYTIFRFSNNFCQIFTGKFYRIGMFYLCNNIGCSI